MADITTSQLNKLLIQSTYRTYVEAIIKATPGKGMVASEWEVEIRGEEIIIYNEEFGDIVKFLEEGTTPHIIKARNGKSLAFPWPDAPFESSNKEGVFFFKKVKHPGIKARRFVQKVMEDPTMFVKWEEELTKGLEKLVSKL